MMGAGFVVAPTWTCRGCGAVFEFDPVVTIKEKANTVLCPECKHTDIATTDEIAIMVHLINKMNEFATAYLKELQGGEAVKITDGHVIDGRIVRVDAGSSGEAGK
ncbi:MAG: hypothetical protein J4F28_02140 [Nitrosopumilaceae archaeon]|nr:hypothetical protein [Nitrosopumilaceae archaeon]